MHLRGVYSHSPQGSVFEVSGIRGLCFSLHPFYHTPSSCYGPMHLSRGRYYQPAVFPVLCNCSSPCLSCYKCFRCYYLVFPKFYYSCPCRQRVPHLGLKPKDASHFSGQGLLPPFLLIYGAEPLPCCLFGRDSCYCSTCDCQG